VAKTAIEVIEQAGYGKLIKYDIGNCIGLDIREKPSITVYSDETLKTGMTVSIQLGLFVPKVGGAYLCDTVLVTDEGQERLTKLRRDLGV